MNRAMAALFERQRTLAIFGLVLFALTPLAMLGQLLDPREIAGVNVWVKPAKFLFSIGLYALTMAWYFGFVRPERRSARPMRMVAAMVVIGGGFEAFYIALQGARGLESHFNTTTPFYTVMYALMGIFATLLTAATLPLAWEIAKRPKTGVRADLVAALVAALALTFVLGAGLGGYMSSQHGHTVGAIGGHVPVFGWNRAGGDLRVAHFLGIHVQQAIPMLALAVGAAGARLRWSVIAGGTALYFVVTVAVFIQAVGGRALLPA